MKSSLSPGLVLVDFDSGDVKKLKKEGFSFGNVLIGPEDEIIFVSIPEKPYKLGRVYCSNRVMTINLTSFQNFEGEPW